MTPVSLPLSPLNERLGKVDPSVLTSASPLDPSTRSSLVRGSISFWTQLFAACLLVYLQALLAGSSVFAAEVTPIQVKRTADKTRYGLIRKTPAETRSPTLFVIAHGIEEMQREPVYTQVARQLADEGWASVILDPPCHGEDIREGEPSQLQGWRHRLENEEDFVGAFCLRASKVLDHLIQEGVTDPERVAACGTSRGGFLAFHLAAADSRLKAAAGISPVTSLMALDEFSTTKKNQNAEQLNVARLASKLAHRPVWLSIGNNDLRVNTDDAILFTRQLVLASAQTDKPAAVIPVELIVAPTAGHTQIDRAHEKLTQWLIDQVKRVNR